MTPGLECEVVDRDGHGRNVAHLRALGVELPRIADLADPPSRLAARAQEIAEVDPDRADVRNLFRVHWHNGADRKSLVDTPEHIVLPRGADRGVRQGLSWRWGNRFPMINAHKVLAAYGCLVPRLLSGAFDVTRHRAVWPSTGNYCRGGVAIARLLGCRSVAVLPEGMSRERFDWLEDWVVDPGDIHRTPGTESNVKEIYDACHVLARDERNLILNQFSEYGNYVVHRAVTGPALERIFAAHNPDGSRTARAFVCASGSAGTLAAGDYLKRSLGTHTCVVEAVECPTLLYNGYGEHNIQGIGDKARAAHSQRHGYRLRDRRLRQRQRCAERRLQHGRRQSLSVRAPQRWPAQSRRSRRSRTFVDCQHHRGDQVREVHGARRRRHRADRGDGRRRDVPI